MAGLTELATGVYAWLQSPGLGRANAGVVVDPDGLTVVDALMVPSQVAPLAATLDELGHPVRRLVLTSSQIEFVGGSRAFPLAAVYGSRVTSAHLEQPPNVAAYQQFLPTYADEFEDLETRRVTHVVRAQAMLSAAVECVPMAGHTTGNLVVRIPAAGIVFAGGMCSFGVTPLAFQGDPAGWAGALDELLELGTTIVPGHGPPGGEAEVRELQGYLRACVDAAGDPDAVAAGPWDRWEGRHLDPINVERAALLARGEDRVPDTMLRAIGMA